MMQKGIFIEFFFPCSLVLSSAWTKQQQW